MRAIGTRAALRRIADFGRDRKACLYYAACVVLLVVAAGLRFHDLSEHYVRDDEAVVATNSGGTLSEVVSNTRSNGSSPILYPLALWAVQKVDVSAFSIRVLPAMASVLTVAVILLLLPRAGVSRRAAFLAALLATLSVAAIENAQDAREYSIDALLAVLMIAGLLWYLRDGRKALLCVSLFLAPLLQYGLVLFGVAVMGAAMVLPSPTLAAPERNSSLIRTRNWIKLRIALVWPAACFLVGCAISYVVTLRYQWQEGGFGSDGYLSAYYYQGQFDVPAIFEFSIRHAGGFLTYHLPEVVVAVFAAFTVLLVAALIRKFQESWQDSAIAVVFSLCIAISMCAAVLGIYPLGHTHQTIYLGPIVFLAAGVAFHWTAGCLAALTRRAWPAPALIVVAAGAIALAGVDDMRRDNPYGKSNSNAKAVLAFLEEFVEEGDVVYVSGMAAYRMKFYQDEKPSNYHYGEKDCFRDFEACFYEMKRLVVSLSNTPNRIFVVHKSRLVWEMFELSIALLGERVSVEHIIGDRDFNIFLLRTSNESDESAARSAYEALVSGEPAIRSTFDVYLSENMLIYVKEPCGEEDVQETFFLRVAPEDVSDLSRKHRRFSFGNLDDFFFGEHGFRIKNHKRFAFDNLDFFFDRHGFRSAELCVARRELPDYAVARVRTGQYLANEDGSYTNLWEGEIRFDE